MVMKKSIAGLIAAVLAVGMMAGCGEKADDSAKKDDSASKGSITVYSPHPADPLNAGVKEFQEKTGITVNVVAAGTGELLKRVEAEAENPLADVFWGGGADSVANYTKYFDEFTPEADSVISKEYKDANHKWVGESPLPMVIMYNKKLVKESDVPKSWSDLLDAKWKGKIAYADPAKSGSSFTILSTMITAYGKDDGKGWDFIKNFYSNLDGKVLSSSSGVYKGVADGEYSVGLTLEKEAQNYVTAGADVGYIYPSDGTSAVPDSIALIKGCKNPDGAKQFINFVLGKDCQSMMAEKYNRRPVRNDMEPPKGLPKMSDIKIVNYDFDWAATGKADILNKWKDIVVGK
ncbi:extracellular solute-binding protein [Clostridium cadaveris]|uniref:Iron ABC transporter substrate-binding protein n=2 Tax=Clostridium cadaveris TaxID=1529 RepID=A0A316M7J3_9CLOT|nr:extracellular solute-binding protein [Clostridium cadaveris]NWK11292.1 extracellular solute-binding protein [Clostridium cadaveris]PWL54376.1 MAG: iron ABC transporter substrate-binding protein [Clostridium cadaveris]UFH65107.1 ABC transporter substrate-binding protein [Clostridium cadaveris]